MCRMNHCSAYSSAAFLLFPLPFHQQQPGSVPRFILFATWLCFSTSSLLEWQNCKYIWWYHISHYDKHVRNMYWGSCTILSVLCKLTHSTVLITSFTDEEGKAISKLPKVLGFLTHKTQRVWLQSLCYKLLASDNKNGSWVQDIAEKANWTCLW